MATSSASVVEPKDTTSPVLSLELSDSPNGTTKHLPGSYPDQLEQGDVAVSTHALLQPNDLAEHLSSLSVVGSEIEAADLTSMSLDSAAK